jgi:hypothetical protein
MSPLEQQLIDLAARLSVPATPDLMAEVRGRLAPRTTRRRRWRHRRPGRRPLVIAVAVMAVIAGTAAAIPPVRRAVERVFGLDGVVINRVPHLPVLPNGPGAHLDLGRRIPVGAAAHAASFRALLPPAGVAAAYVSAHPPGGRISLFIGPSLIMEFRGQPYPFIEKLIGPGTRIRRLRVNGGRGVYLDRAPHAVLFLNERGHLEVDSIRREGSVLVWQQGPLILRIEGAGSLSRALALARSLR